VVGFYPRIPQIHDPWICGRRWPRGDPGKKPYSSLSFFSFSFFFFFLSSSSTPATEKLPSLALVPNEGYISSRC
jgi:hypothetical protein